MNHYNKAIFSLLKGTLYVVIFCHLNIDWWWLKLGIGIFAIIELVKSAYYDIKYLD